MSDFPDTSKADEQWKLAAESFEEAFYERFSALEVGRHKIYVASSGMTGLPDASGTTFYDFRIHVAKHFRNGWGSGILAKVQQAAIEAANRTGLVTIGETGEWEDKGSFGFVDIEFKVS